MRSACGRAHQLSRRVYACILAATAVQHASCTFDVHRYRLQAVAAGGWRPGRASFDDPTPAFQQNFTTSHFGIPYNGNCGLYDGHNTSDTTAALVPASMRAAIVESAAIFPGSCGRCYEVRCASGVVPRNTSGVPYPLQDANVPYNWSRVGSAALMDKYSRPFPGNSLAANDEIFTQCWNATDQPAGQDLLNNNSATIVKIIGSGQCQQAKSSLCTDLTHFLLDYSAFEKLAHPGYGYMNLQYRPVDCQTSGDLPYLPGFVNTTIYSDHMEAGWGFHPYISGQAYPQASMLQYQGAGIDQSNASCVTLPSQGTLYFNCPDCSEPGYQPFLLSNTSGISFWIKATKTADNGTLTPASGWPAVTVMLGNDDMSQTCNATVNLQDPAYSPFVKIINNNYLLQRTVLLQNEFHGCIPQLANITSIGFQAASGAGPVSFCLDQVQLLPSTMREVAEADPNPKLHNCYQPQPLPVNQYGSYLTNVGFPGAQNVTAADSAAGYTQYQFTDMQTYADLHPVLGSCFPTTTQLNADQQEVNQCAGSTNYCCYNFTVNPLNTSKSDFLVGLCNTMSTNGSICQAFNFQADTNIGWFKGQAAQQQFDLSKTCLSPNITSWILNAAVPPGLTDTRAIAAGTPGSSNHPYCDAVPNTVSPYNRQMVTTATAANDAIMTPSVTHNVIGNSTDLGYTTYIHMDMQGMYDLKTATGDSCFNVTPSGNMSAVDMCHQSHSLLCCVNLADIVGKVDSSMPDTLAQICNDINVKSTSSRSGYLVCQGFVYDSYQQVAFFKGQAANQSITLDSTCYRPNSTLWLLNAALNASSQGDTRVQPGGSVAAAADHKKHDFPWGAVYGVLAAVLAPAIPFATWLLVTFSYRQDKLMIIRQVGKHVSEADLGRGAADDAVSSQQSSSRSASSRGSLQGSEDFNDQLLNSWAMPVAAAPAMQDTARKIAIRSLRRWDAFLGFRAGHDGLGRTLGVWKDKFDGVRFAVLLLAMRKLNQQVKLRRGGSGSLMEDWQKGSWTQQNALLDQLARVLQNITETEAQDLPHKDPDVPGMHDKLYGMVTTCCRR